MSSPALFAGRRMTHGAIRELTGQEKLFVISYLKCGDQVQAYKDAGYSTNMSARSMQSGAYRVSCRPAVSAAINRAMATRKHAATVDGAKLLNSLWNMTNADVRELFDKATGDLLPPAQWPEDIGRAVQSLDLMPNKKGGTAVVRVVLANRSQNAQTLAKALRLFNEAPQVAVNVDLRGVKTDRLHELAAELARQLGIGEEEVIAGLAVDTTTSKAPPVPAHEEESPVARGELVG